MAVVFYWWQKPPTLQFLSKSDGKSNGESYHVTASLVILKTYLNCYTPLSSEKVTKFMDLMNCQNSKRNKEFYQN
jgi:hypothetical protein